MKDPKDITINGKQLSDILAAHKKWILDEGGGERANLSGANLSGANLSDANLSYANLSGANLSDANLSNANLSYANLSDANLRYANLSDANLSNANLSYANLRYANLRYANLSDAENLSEAKNRELAEAIVTIVPEGDIIGWKKCNKGVIVKLLIPAAAKRSNATGRKCRAEYAQVLEVIGAETGTTDSHGPETIYTVGEIIRPDKWDENRWNECSNGIHFFITRCEAENY